MKGKERILYSEDDIRERVAEMAKTIDDYYEGKEILVIGLLRGCFVFCSDLVRAMESKMEVDFMTTSSYEDEFSSSGEVKLFSDLRADVKGRDYAADFTGFTIDDVFIVGYGLNYGPYYRNKPYIYTYEED